MKYRFSQWENGETSPTRTVNLTADITVVATYSVATRKLTFQSQPITVQAVVDGVTVKAGESVEFPEGTNVTIAVPSEVST